MFSPLIAIYRNPADRRKWLTIAAALVAFYGFGQTTPWALLLTVAAILAGYDIALRAWASLRLLLNQRAPDRSIVTRDTPLLPA